MSKDAKWRIVGVGIRGFPDKASRDARGLARTGLQGMKHPPGGPLGRLFDDRFFRHVQRACPFPRRPPRITVQHVYARASTASQSLLRQRHILTEAGLLVRAGDVAGGFRPASGVRLYEDPATTSKVPALRRPAFGRIAAAAHPGDALTISELFRLCRDLTDIQAVRDWCQARGVALRVLSGPLSNFADLSANDATTDLIVNVLIAVGQFQRDLQNELTAEGIAAAEAEGRYRGQVLRRYRRTRPRRSRTLPGSTGPPRLHSVRTTNDPDDIPSGIPSAPQIAELTQIEQEGPGPGSTEAQEGSGNSGVIF